MQSRHQFLAQTGVVITAGFAGCLSSFSSGKNRADMSQEEKEIVDQYEKAHHHHSKAIEIMGEALTDYKNSNYEEAKLQFEEAWEEFKTAEQQLPRVYFVDEETNEAVTDKISEATSAVNRGQTIASISAEKALPTEGDQDTVSPTELVEKEELSLDHRKFSIPSTDEVQSEL